MSNGCVTPKCWRQALKDHLFCKDCRRLITDEERQALRMIVRSPAYGPSAFEGHDGKTNILWDWHSRHEGRAYKSVEDASRILHWAEYRMACMTIGKRIARAHLRQAAKGRLSLRRR